MQVTFCEPPAFAKSASAQIFTPSKRPSALSMHRRVSSWFLDRVLSNIAQALSRIFIGGCHTPEQDAFFPGFQIAA
jgi:hypothetical protein